jgi:hypothetical protein
MQPRTTTAGMSAAPTPVAAASRAE